MLIPKKVKLSTFIHKDLCLEHLAGSAVCSLLTFLPEMYAAQLRHRRWLGPLDEDKVSFRDQYLHSDFRRFKDANRAFRLANRVEMQIRPVSPKMPLPDESGKWIVFDITFFDGKKSDRLMSQLFHVETGAIAPYRIGYYLD